MTESLKLLAAILIAAAVAVILARQITATMRRGQDAEYNPGCTLALIIIAIIGVLIGVGSGWR
jgi:hypothetical protein